MTKGRAGKRWDNVVEKIWKGLGGDQKDTLSVHKFGGCETEVKERIKERERLAVRNEVIEENTWGVEGTYWNESICTVQCNTRKC